MRAHDDQVRVDFTRIADDFALGRERVTDGGFDIDSLFAKRARDRFKIFLAGFDFGSGSIASVDLAGDSFFHVQQVDAGASGAPWRRRA